MKTFLFIGANSDIAIEARKQQEKKGNRVLSFSRSDNSEFGDFLVADPLKNEFPALEGNIDDWFIFLEVLR